MDDVTQLTQLVLRERQARDRGWWDQMRRCIHPDARIRLSWFRGSGAEFVTASEQMSAAGGRSTHRLSPPVVFSHEHRAVVEVGAAIEVRARIAEVDVDVTSFTRILYRAESQDGAWVITALDPIYERDTVTPVVPGEVPPIDRTRLAGLRPSYGFLSYLLADRGYEIDDDLVGDDRPDGVDALYRDAFDWLG